MKHLVEQMAQAIEDAKTKRDLGKPARLGIRKHHILMLMETTSQKELMVHTTIAETQTVGLVFGATQQFRIQDLNYASQL
jgi:hypothetical protein